MLARSCRRPVRLGLLVAAVMLAAGGLPSESDATGCATAVPPEATRFRPLTVNPRLWDRPAVRAGHPRLYVDAEALKRLKVNWRDPAYRDIVEPLSRQDGSAVARPAVSRHRRCRPLSCRRPRCPGGAL